ncbi:hypothetical protein H310_09710 [Aphanomyces invadans]|uniref:Uncharacterized protein n=1 Tax=Aphanomyces invadans TaxID=157072 RepID=A0A024TTN4_9STRA|nr:hypothetical protein H310_09710 [Aphanomyces invadans]ETV97374.1 hypothetical protein H310_09710 [Aphanomyces invadans]|eukprot:XP_008874082.1 hypothetical protein H310_09710 [Aphanomyces invadans]
MCICGPEVYVIPAYAPADSTGSVSQHFQILHGLSTSPMRNLAKCFFNGCTNDAVLGSWKCMFHFHRFRCSVAKCRNQVYARGRCVRHGGKKLCDVDGCGMNRRLGRYCVKHGPPTSIKLCSELGCDKHAHLHGKCVRHGGGRRCSVAGCSSHARGRPFCIRHTPSKLKPSESDEDNASSNCGSVDDAILDLLLQQTTPKFTDEYPGPLLEWTSVFHVIDEAIKLDDFSCPSYLRPPVHP